MNSGCSNISSINSDRSGTCPNRRDVWNNDLASTSRLADLALHWRGLWWHRCSTALPKSLPEAYLLKLDCAQRKPQRARHRKPTLGTAIQTQSRTFARGCRIFCDVHLIWSSTCQSFWTVALLKWNTDLPQMREHVCTNGRLHDPDIAKSIGCSPGKRRRIILAPILDPYAASTWG
jgi:hypothetical protein